MLRLPVCMLSMPVQFRLVYLQKAHYLMHPDIQGLTTTQEGVHLELSDLWSVIRVL
jgi:hypothetical protein